MVWALALLRRDAKELVLCPPCGNTVRGGRRPSVSMEESPHQNPPSKHPDLELPEPKAVRSEFCC